MEMACCASAGRGTKPDDLRAEKIVKMLVLFLNLLTVQPASMEFRAPHIGHAAAISALIRRFSHDFTIHPGATGAEQFFESVSPAAEAGYIADPRYRYIAAFEGHELAGFIAMRDRSHVFHLFVAPEFQRRGVAARLWQAVAEVGDVDCFTVNSSRLAVPVYERFGFTRTGPLVEKHGICFVPMRLSLSNVASSSS